VSSLFNYPFYKPDNVQTLVKNLCTACIAFICECTED